MNRYRVLLPLTVHTKDGSYTQGDEFEQEYTAEEEDEVLAYRGGGMLEIVPREYKVIGGSNVHGADPGGTFTAALRIGEEAALLQGGHIERVEKPAPKSKTKKKEE